jgi:hypothetical protein
MVNDLILLSQTAPGSNGSKQFVVGASATLIVPGEPVAHTRGSNTVTKMATNKPVIKTDYLAGVAVSTSTNTASAAGTVEVQPITVGQVWLANPNASTAWDTQAEYNALVGAQVVLDLTGTYPTEKYTILATDNATYGCIIEPLDIAKHPGKVAFTFNGSIPYTNLQD